MSQSLGLVSLVVREYDEAIAFFVGTPGFTTSVTPMGVVLRSIFTSIAAEK